MTTKNLTHEQALKEAEEYVKSGKPKNGYTTLNEFILSRKKGQWNIVFEKIMTLYIDLAIRLQNFSAIKDCLNQYKYISQGGNINTLEIVVLYYREKMEALFKEKSQECKLDKLDELDDIDSEESPESLLLLSIDMKAKSEREITKAVLKNIWDCLKNIVEIVRTNSKLDEILISTCEKLFRFCVDYKRKIEFKRFSENHRYFVNKILRNLVLYPDYLKTGNAVDITDVTTNERYLSIFAQQMQTALNLKLWQEAFKISEDMHSVMKVRKSILKPKFLSAYFENLAKVFWSSRYYLYHANAFYSHYVIYKKFSKAKTDEIQAKSNQLFLSILTIPPFAIENEQKDENRLKISNLLSSSGALPQRGELISILRNTNLLELVSPEINELFCLLEDEFNLLTFAKKAEVLFKQLEDNANYKFYLEPIKQNLVYKILVGLREAYKTVTLQKLYKILNIIPKNVVEDIILTAHAQNFIKVKIDHNKQILIFENEDFTSKNEFVIRLAKDIATLRQKISKTVDQEEKAEIESDVLAEAREYLENSEKLLKNRVSLIVEAKKPETYTKIAEKMKEEEKKQKKDEKDREEELKKKKLDDKKKIKEAELKESEMNRKFKYLQELIKAKGSQIVKIEGRKIENFVKDDLEFIDMASLEELRNMVHNKEKENIENKYKRNFQKVDFTERGKRDEEKAYIEKFWDSDEKEIDEINTKAKDLYQRHFQQKQALLETLKFKEKHIKTKMDKRKENFEKEILKFREEVAKEFKQAILEKAKELLEKQKKRDEEDRKKKEEDSRKRYEEEVKQKEDSDWRVIKDTKEPQTKLEDAFGFRSRPERPEKKIESASKAIEAENWRLAKEKITATAVQQGQVQAAPKETKEEPKVAEDPSEWRNVGAPKKEREIKETAPGPKTFENKAPSRFGFGGDKGGDKGADKGGDKLGEKVGDKGERKPAGEGFGFGRAPPKKDEVKGKAAPSGGEFWRR